jgi:hypothetical protein
MSGGGRKPMALISSQEMPKLVLVFVQVADVMMHRRTSQLPYIPSLHLQEFMID